MLVVFLKTFIACDGPKTQQAGKPIIMATLFPQYDFVRQIAKDHFNVQLILPPGVEPHAFGPTPRDIVTIHRAKIFIYTGKYMEPWAEKLIQGGIPPQLIVVDASRDIALLKPDHDNHHGHTHADHHHSHHGQLDPHIWLDPLHAKTMVRTILAALEKADPANRAAYQKNAAAYQKRLERLHADFTELFKKSRSKHIFLGGHFAFAYFAKRYGLTYASPYPGLSPNAEPSARAIARLIRAIKVSKAEYIFNEELIDPKVARTIARETGARMLLLHGVHNISKSERDKGETYLSLMYRNLHHLKIGLGHAEKFSLR